MQTPFDQKQYQFGLACKENTIDNAKEQLAQGVKLEGIHLGVAASFPTNLAVFDWLLEQDCPVNGDTWLYIIGLPNSVDLIKRIVAKKPELQHGLPRSEERRVVEEKDEPLLEYLCTYR